jgi:hypothetical protein
LGKIIDFGTAKFFDKNKKEKSVPEVLKKSYNEKCEHGQLELSYIC